MSKLEVDAIEPQSGTTITIGAAGDTVNLIGTLQSNGSPLPGDISEVVAGTGLSGGGTTGAVTINIDSAQPTITSLGTITSFRSTGIDDNADATAITIDSSENVGIGTTSPSNKLDIYNGGINVDTTGGALTSTRYNSGSGSTNIVLQKSQTDTIGNQSALTNGYGIGGIITKASDGTSFISATAIFHQVDGTVSTNSVPSRITFSTNSGSTAYSERMRITSAGSVGIGTTSPSLKLEVSGQIKSTGITNRTSFQGVDPTPVDANSYELANGYLNLYRDDTAEVNQIQFGKNGTLAAAFSTGANYLAIKTNGDNERMRIDSSGNVGIGTTSPASIGSNITTLEITGGSTIRQGGIYLSNSDKSVKSYIYGSNTATVLATESNIPLVFSTNNTERMRIDSSGNVLVGTTSTTPATGTSSGNLISSIGRNQFSSDSDTLEVNRHGSEGIIVSLRKDGTRIGSINVRSVYGVYEFGSLGTGIGGTSSHAWIPMVSNVRSDNTTSLGQASYRMTDIYATNGTIATSDQNEKQSIQSLTTAEMNVGKKLSSLIKTYKWNSSVEEKGDSARTHTGIIAQDVQQAFNDEGLDASKYGLWCSDTWSIDADGERIENSEEVTENNSSKNKLGIRYEQLLSFIQAYNDQRFTELEARITQLENA